MSDAPSAPECPPVGYPLPNVVAAVSAVLSIVGLVSWHNLTYAASCAAAAAAVGGLEVDRVLRCPEVPWWMRHCAVLPWVALVIFPWTVRLAQGSWPVGTDGNLPDPSLPKVWLINLLALAGLAAGSLGRLAPAPPPNPPPDGDGDDPADRRVAAGPLLWHFAVLAAVLLASFVVAGRPLSALWRLSGVRYSADVDTHTRVGALDLMPVAAISLTLAATGIRRRYRSRPTPAELVVLIPTLVVTLGSGSRYRFFTVLLGWLLIQTGIGGVTKRPGFGRAFLRTCLVPVMIVVTIGGLGIISARRAPVAGPVDVVGRALNAFDVLGAEELIVERGATPGSLHLRTYVDLPRQLTPHVLTGGTRPPAATVAAIQTYLDPQVGYSMPYWFEAVLNVGAVGGLISGAFYAAALTRFLGRCARSRVLTRRCFWLFGPTTLLLSYQLLSRIETEQLLATCAALWLGVWFASHSTRRVRPETGFRPERFRYEGIPEGAPGAAGYRPAAAAGRGRPRHTYVS